MNNPCEKHTNVKAECCLVCLSEQYEKLKKILTPDEKCNACHGRGYTVFYDHNTYPVPHDIEHHFLCSCVQSKVLKFFGANGKLSRTEGIGLSAIVRRSYKTKK